MGMSLRSDNAAEATTNLAYLERRRLVPSTGGGNLAAFLAPVALAAMLLSSWRAWRVNPLAALREDG